MAEWSLSPSSTFTRESYPHILAVVAQAALDSQKTNPTSNCRTLLSPKALKEMMTGSEMGLKCVEEKMFDPDDTNLDGMWEVDMVLDKSFEEDLRETVDGVSTGVNAEGKQRWSAALLAMRDAIRASLPEKGVKGVRSMPVWCAKFATD